MYPNYPSNIIHLSELLNEGENRYYKKIYEKYGKMYRKKQQEENKNFEDSGPEEESKLSNVEDEGSFEIYQS